MIVGAMVMCPPASPKDKQCEKSTMLATSRRPERIMILMAIYNGAATLGQQIESLHQQTFQHWDLTVSDDGSGDDSRTLVKTLVKDGSRKHKVDIRDGPGLGFAENFLSLLANLPEAPGPVALADQDDVWLPEKLARAHTQLAHVPIEQPALYCSRRYIWSPGQSGECTTSYHYQRPPGFANALIENIAPGNTIALNAAAAKIARDAARLRPPGIFTHDWWLYLVLSGMGAKVIFDPTPTLLYRQHNRNVLGAGERRHRQIRNKAAVLRGLFAQRVAGNLAALAPLEAWLTAENRTRLALFRQARMAPLPRRITLLHQAGVYRQRRLSNLGFWGAAYLGLV